jgi:hypothetical protein
MEAQDYDYMEDQPRQPQMPFLNMAQQYGSSMLQMTNPEGEILKMEMALKSQVVDKEGKVRQVGRPLLNEIGLSSVIGQVQTIVNQTTIMSNFDKHEIPILVDYLGDTLAKDLMINRVAYEIQTKAARSKIYYIALSSAFICLKRAFEQGERGFWGRIQQEIKQYVEGGSSNQGGFFQKLLGWGAKH